MRAHIIKDGIITNTIVVNSLTDIPNLLDASLGGQIGDAWDGSVFTTPESDPEPVTLGILSTDMWNIPADGTTFATVKYTSNSTVYFAVESAIHIVEPINQVATIEITADAVGPIRVDVQDKRLVIAALEVV